MNLSERGSNLDPQGCVGPNAISKRAQIIKEDPYHPLYRDVSGNISAQPQPNRDSKPRPNIEWPH